jgi:hypothetical protein
VYINPVTQDTVFKSASSQITRTFLTHALQPILVAVVRDKGTRVFDGRTVDDLKLRFNRLLGGQGPFEGRLDLAEHSDHAVVAR